MRSWTELRRGRRPDSRGRSRFGRGAKGNRDLNRFRRNRELLARESTMLVLWVAVAVMLLNLAGTLHRVAIHQLAERAALIRYSLPTVAVLAALGSLWRARLNLREIQELRTEQAGVKNRLLDARSDEDLTLP